MSGNLPIGQSVVSKRVKLWLFKAGLLVFSLLPASCHYTLTGPALWSHNSSAAFDLWAFLWLMNLAAMGAAIWFAVTVKE